MPDISGANSFKKTVVSCWKLSPINVTINLPELQRERLLYGVVDCGKPVIVVILQIVKNVSDQ